MTIRKIRMLLALFAIAFYYILAAEGRCTRDQFTCNNKECIDKKLLCDSNDDCYDGSDETIAHCIGMSCSASHFQCGYGGCLPMAKKCDGTEDCKDGSDEASEACDVKPQFVQPVLPETSLSSNNTPGRCSLPDQPLYGKYTVENCGKEVHCNTSPRLEVGPSTLLKFSCYEHYILSRDSPYAVCDVNGHWVPNVPDCLRYCNPLKSSSKSFFICTHNGKETECDKPIRPGTSVETVCKPWYESIYQRLNGCAKDGSWVRDFAGCAPKCGLTGSLKVEEDSRPLIANGTLAKASEHPWHVALYEDDGVKYICGGSIISDKAILTAAHCISDDGGNVKDRLRMRVAVGKYHRSWEKNDESEQRFRVKEIIKYSAYRGRYTDFEHDIAILVVDGIIKLNGTVLPICRVQNNFDIFNENPLSTGVVVGWGDIGNGSTSEVLRLGEFSGKNILNFNLCHQKMSEVRLRKQQFVRYDKFCLLTRQGPYLGTGDSGGGLTVLTEGPHGSVRHFIYGIVSLSLTSQNDFHLSAFTNITLYAKWIEEMLLDIDKID